MLAEVEVRTTHDGKIVGLPAIRSLRLSSDFAYDFADSDRAAVEVSRESIDAGGRTWDCRLTVARWLTGSLKCERRIWMNPDIPIYGVARMELFVDGHCVARMELAGVGRLEPTSRASP